MKDYFITKATINKSNKQINICPPKKKLSKKILKLIKDNKKVKVRLYK